MQNTCWGTNHCSSCEWAQSATWICIWQSLRHEVKKKWKLQWLEHTQVTEFTERWKHMNKQDPDLKNKEGHRRNTRPTHACITNPGKSSTTSSILTGQSTWSQNQTTSHTSIFPSFHTSLNNRGGGRREQPWLMGHRGAARHPLNMTPLYLVTERQ